ncbi:MAG: hypothetical protein JRI23_28620 [Deltaproteobacteria bacterium]|nr:hypothetical protein [Deltaproteobacteria bacterium]MBW2536062.1 hypothetical protein [Deltaproteobacteria bacterium]
MSPITERTQHASALGTTTAQVGTDSRAARIVAKAIYKEARGAGMQDQAVIAVATELLGLVAADMRASRS